MLLFAGQALDVLGWGEMESSGPKMKQRHDVGPDECEKGISVQSAGGLLEGLLVVHASTQLQNIFER